MTFFLSRDFSGSFECHQSRPTSRSWLRAAIELSSLKSIRDVAKVRKKVPSGKWTGRFTEVPVSGDQPRQWSLHSPRVNYLWSCSGTAAGRCRWGPADGRCSAETAWPRPLHCPGPSCWRWAGKGKTRNRGTNWMRLGIYFLTYLEFRHLHVPTHRWNVLLSFSSVRWNSLIT